MAPEFYANNCEGAVASGTNWTTANQGASGDPLTITRTGGTMYSTTTAGEVIHGGQSVKLTPGGVQTQRLAFPLTSGPSANGRCYYRLTAAPGADASLVTLQGSTGACATVKLSSTTSRLRMENAAGTTPTGGSPATAITYPKVIGLDVICTPGTSTADGTARLVIYNEDGSTFADTGDIISNFFRTGVVTEVRFGVAVDYTVVADSFTASNAYVLAGPVISSVSVPVAVAVTAAGSVSRASGATVANTAGVAATGVAATSRTATAATTVAVTAVGAVTSGLTGTASSSTTVTVTAAGNIAASRGATIPLTASVVASAASGGHAEIAGISGTGGAPVGHGHAEIAGVSGGATAVTPPGAPGSGHAEIAGISGLAFLSTDLQARAPTDFSVDPIKDVLLDGTLSTGAWAAATWTVVSDSRVAQAAPYPTVLAPIELSPDTDALITVNFPAHPDTYAVVCQLTITDGITISVDTCTVTVWAWIFWRKFAGKLVPLQRYRVVP